MRRKQRQESMDYIDQKRSQFIQKLNNEKRIQDTLTTVKSIKTRSISEDLRKYKKIIRN
jgi:hypothetical protein